MSKQPEQNCCTCKNGYVLRINGHVICKKHGIISPAEECKAFEFDPFRKQPTPRSRMTLSYSEADFSID